ncbi:hypothetical protein CR513_35703, partial [Mucuna pruriens]
MEELLQKDSKYNKDKTQVVCYECKKREHFKSECPTLEKKKSKRKKPIFKKKKKKQIYSDDEYITFGGNQKGKKVRIDKIGKTHFPTIENALFFEGLKHNILSISQLCDNGHDVSFNKEKQVKGSFKSKNVVSTYRPLELLHIDWFGPTISASVSVKLYMLVVVDDYATPSRSREHPSPSQL